jgi:nucleotide-binding universal stress UspA family protein
MNTQTSKPNTDQLKAFRIRRALVGLEMRQTDEKLLQYIDFLHNLIPVESITFLHQLASYTLFNHLFKDERQLARQQAEKKKQIMKRMQQQIKQHFRMPSTSDLSHEVRIGDPLVGLLERADELDADLMLVGQKIYEGGHGVLSRKLAGLLQSNALIVPQRASLSMHKILVPVDFSEPSRHALETAVRLQQQIQEKPTIICLHIFEMPEFADQDSFTNLVREDQAHSLAEFVRPYEEQGGGPFQSVILEKELITRTGLYILEYGLEEGVDLIVLGARGLSPIERMVMGSVTERLLSENDDIPTLVVK